MAMSDVTPDQDEPVDGHSRMDTDDGLLTEPSGAKTANISQVGRVIVEQTPSPIQPEQTRFNAPARVETNQLGAQVQVSRDEQHPIEISLSAEEIPTRSTRIVSEIRQLQGDSGLYKMTFEELQQLVGEVIREPGFPELVSSHMYLIGKSKGYE
jgi:hypothetical protein